MAYSFYARGYRCGSSEQHSHYPRHVHRPHRDHRDFRDLQDPRDHRIHRYQSSYYGPDSGRRHSPGDDLVPPAEHSWLDGAKKRGQLESDLALLKADGLPAPKDLGLTENEAMKLAGDALNAYHRSDVHALSRSSSQSRRNYPRSELPFRVFNELDQELFRGVLKGNVHLRWSNIPLEYPGMTSRPGNTFSRITIELNNHFHRRPEDRKWGRESLLAALIHQMVHAYFLVCCSHRSTGAPGKQHDLGHGLPFSTLLHKIRERFRPNPLFSKILTYSGSGQLRSASQRRSPYPGSQTYSPAHLPLGSSRCFFFMDDQMSEAACRNYFHNLPAVNHKESSQKEGDSKSGATNPYPIERFLFDLDPNTRIPKPILRSEYRVPQSEFVELHFDGQAYPVSRVKFTAHPSLRIKLQQIHGSKCVTIPASSFDEFLSLILFLEKGNYPPEISDQFSHVRPDMGKGPPKIGEFKHDSKPYLITDIGAYSIARKIGFEELEKKALGRLYAHTFTNNDPMEALEEIYQRLEPVARDKPLRKWVVQWLLTPRCEHEIRTNGLTNFEFLCTDPHWKDKFGKLRQKGGDFLQDCDAVQNELLKSRGYSSSYTSLLSAGSTAPSGSGQSGGNTTSPMFAPTPMQTPTFRDTLPPRSFADHRSEWMPTRESTPCWPGPPYGWGNGPAYR